MSELKPLVAFFFFLVLFLPFASADDSYNWPWGVSLQPFVIYADSNGALIAVDYDYYEEAGHQSEGVLKPVLPWSYFLFYINQSGVYYVNFTGFSGYETVPLTFYNGWLYLFVPTCSTVEFPVRAPPVSGNLLILRYREGRLQKLGEVPWLGGINVSMPYLLVLDHWGEGRILYRIKDSVELIARGSNLTLENRVDVTDRLLVSLHEKSCLQPVLEGDYVLFAPSHYRVPLKELEGKVEPVNLSCATFFGEGLLIVPPSIGVGFANNSMWVQPNTNYHTGIHEIVLNPAQKRPQESLNFSLYLYERGRIKELPIFQVSEKGVRVLTPPIEYSEVAHGEWYQRQSGIFCVLFLAVLISLLVILAVKKRSG